MCVCLLVHICVYQRDSIVYLCAHSRIHMYITLCIFTCVLFVHMWVCLYKFLCAHSVVYVYTHYVDMYMHLFACCVHVCGLAHRGKSLRRIKRAAANIFSTRKTLWSERILIIIDDIAHPGVDMVRIGAPA